MLILGIRLPLLPVYPAGLLSVLIPVFAHADILEYWSGWHVPSGVVSQAGWCLVPGGGWQNNAGRGGIMLVDILCLITCFPAYRKHPCGCLCHPDPRKDSAVAYADGNTCAGFLIKEAKGELCVVSVLCLPVC